MPMRNQKGEKLEILFAQKNKWNKNWLQYWFYVRTGGLTSTGEDGRKNTGYPLASVMTTMKPSTQGTLRPEAADGREACDKAFALASRYSGGHDLVEEMVAANCWPLGRNKPIMSIEMAHLLVFEEGVVIPFPRFGFQKEGRAAENLVKSIEARARKILGKMSNKEYLACRVLAGTMPHLN